MMMIVAVCVLLLLLLPIVSRLADITTALNRLAPSHPTSACDTPTTRLPSHPLV